MFGLGFTELLIIMTVALLVFGPKKLPEMARTLGRTMGELRRTLDEVKYEISQGELEARREEEELRKEAIEKSSEEAAAAPTADKPEQQADAAGEPHAKQKSDGEQNP